MIVQGTPEWHAMRLGKVTASRVADVIAKTKSGYSASRDNYMAQLICERLTGTAAESYTNADMEHGVQTEALARAAYEQLRDVLVDEVAFVKHPRILMTGASPDGLVGADGLIEIKCPKTATHLDTLEKQEVPAKYLTQMYWQMACTGRQWCDFVSYDNRLPKGLDVYIERVPRDNEHIAWLETEVEQFLSELDKRLIFLQGKMNE